MPKVTFVQSARKANPKYGIEVGDAYYHWAFMVGGRGGPKICSKTRPTRSQLTQSAFKQAIYGFYDDNVAEIEKAASAENVDWGSIADDVEGLAEALREIGNEEQEKFDNMPDSLQQGDSGQLLEARANGCNEAADEIDTSASEFRSKVEELDSEKEEYDALVQKWKDYDDEYAEWDALDEDEAGDAPEEPDEERPDERDFDEEYREALSEAMSTIGGTEETADAS